MAGKRPSTRLTLIPAQQHVASVINAMEMTVKQVPPGVPDDTRRELDIPMDRRVLKLTIAAQDNSPGYAFEVVAADPEPETALPRPWLSLEALASYGAMYITVYRRRVRWDSAPGVYVESRWHPLHGKTNA